MTDKDCKEFVQKLINNMSTIEVIKILRCEIDQFCQVGVELLLDARKYWESTNTDVSESDSIAQCMLQMIYLKARTLLQMSKGVQIDYNTQSSIVDYSSMQPVLRSMYEMCFIYNNIYSMTDNEHERIILLNIWKIRGYNSRQRISNPKEPYKTQQEKEKRQIEKLRKEIWEKAESLSFSDKAKKGFTWHLKV